MGDTEFAAAVADEVAEDLSLGLIDGVINMPFSQRSDAYLGNLESREDLVSLKAQNEQLQAELASARSEIEFATLKEEELENRYEKTIANLQKNVDSLGTELQKAVQERAAGEAA